jgi:transcription antitermination factor NusG
MMGLEGKITRVDRRKKRAKILIELEGRSFNIDLPYEILQASEPSQKNSQKECQQ